MATATAIGKRRADAIQRIETLLGEGLNLPRQSRFGVDMLLVLQLERIAEYLETAQVAQPKRNKIKQEDA